MYNERDLHNPSIIIDANHANSNKLYKEQIRIVKEVLHSRKLSSEISQMVKGVMIESYIEGGSQKVSDHVYGKSITDPCLGWEDSEKLIYTIADNI
jgi:3-deoxy-7-phosphoheptulonate synthase